MKDLIIPTSSNRLFAKTFVARAVLNIELVTQVLAKATHVIYEPILRGSFSGVESYRTGIFFTIGKIVPPLLAVFEGINGASKKSARAIA